jgi:hypothetical protein
MSHTAFVSTIKGGGWVKKSKLKLELHTEESNLTPSGIFDRV